MAKPESKLVNTPVEDLVGDPGSRTGVDTSRGGVSIEGAPKENYSEGIETVTLVTGLGGPKQDSTS